MDIQVNGERHRLGSEATVLDLLKKVVSTPDGVAVELNLKIIDRKDFSQTVLREGVRVEIIRFVGGGSFHEK